MGALFQACHRFRKSRRARILELTVCKIGPKRSRLGQFAPEIISGLPLVSLIKDPHHVRSSLSPLHHRDPEQESCSIHYGIQDAIIRDALRSFVPPSNPEKLVGVGGLDQKRQRYFRPALHSLSDLGSLSMCSNRIAVPLP